MVPSGSGDFAARMNAYPLLGMHQYQYTGYWYTGTSILVTSIPVTSILFHQYTSNQYTGLPVLLVTSIMAYQ